MNALQKTIESQRNVNDLTSTFMIEERHNWEKVKVLTSHDIRKKLNDQKQSDKGLQQWHDELKLKWTRSNVKSEGMRGLWEGLDF